MIFAEFSAAKWCNILVVMLHIYKAWFQVPFSFYSHHFRLFSCSLADISSLFSSCSLNPFLVYPYSPEENADMYPRGRIMHPWSTGILNPCSWLAAGSCLLLGWTCWIKGPFSKGLWCVIEDHALGTILQDALIRKRPFFSSLIRSHHDGETRLRAVGKFKPIGENLSGWERRDYEPPAEEQRDPSAAQVHRLWHPGDPGAEQGAVRGPEEPAQLAAGRGAPDRRQVAAGPRRDGCGCRDGITRPRWDSVVLQTAGVSGDGAVGRTGCSPAAPQQVRRAAGHQPVRQLRSDTFIIIIIIIG